MIEDIGRIRVEPDGVRIADKVNFVSTQGKLHAEFSSNDAAAAVSWIAGNADAHSFSMHSKPKVRGKKTGTGLAVDTSCPRGDQNLYIHSVVLRTAVLITMISSGAGAQSAQSYFKNEVSGGYLYGDSLVPYEAYGGSSGYSLSLIHI